MIQHYTHRDKPGVIYTAITKPEGVYIKWRSHNTNFMQLYDKEKVERMERSGIWIQEQIKQ